MVDHRLKVEKILVSNLKYSHEENSLKDWDVDLKSLGLDSFSSINILLCLENEFNITIPDEYLNDQTFETPNTLLNVVQNIVNA
ncbi:MAG: phosphopantetheine-binding protein [Flavisolibacter sp.]